MKTVRFSQVVARSGKPEPHTFWSKPEEDRPFQAALKAHRVMTVHQETTGSKKDYGEIGFTKDRHGNLLIFPKSLKPFEGLRVIGVKYDLLDLPPAPAARPEPAAKAKPAAKESPAAPAQKLAALRVFDPEETAPPEPRKKVSPPKPRAPADLATLTKEVRLAMKQLEAGKAVAAYQTLEQAIGQNPKAE